jgi:hypothetical protein
LPKPSPRGRRVVVLEDQGATETGGETRVDARNNSGIKHIRHPDVGDLEFIYEAVNLPDYPGWTMFAYTSAVGSPTEERIQLLGSLSSTPTEARASAPGN